MAPDSDIADDTGATAAADQPEQPSEETEVAQAADGAGSTTTKSLEESDAPGANASWPAATTPETPDRGAAHTGRHNAQAAETEPDVETLKAGPGCTTPPPPPARGTEGSDTQSADGRGSPLHGEKPSPRQAGAGVKRDDVVTAAKSRLLAFRSFSRDRKAVKSGGAEAAASPERRGAGEEGGAAEHKETGKERRKRFWK